MPPRAPNPGRRKGQSREASYLSIPPLPPPAETRPVVFCIPDHPDWRASLYSSISLMGSWLAWKRDDAHSGKDVAAIWNNIITNAQLAAERGEEQECMDWCMIIADCIANDASTREALKNTLIDHLADEEIQKILRDVLTGSGGGTETIVGPDCDYSTLTGGILSLVEHMNDNNVDFLQSFEPGSNKLERVSRLMSVIPLFGLLPLDEVVSFVDEVFGNILENYDAQWTNAVRDEIVRDLFCIAYERGDCTMTFEDIYLYFDSRLDAGLTLNSALQALVEFVLTGEMTGTRIVDFMFQFQLITMLNAGDFIGVTRKSLITAWLIGRDDPSPLWEDANCLEEEPTITLIKDPAFWLGGGAGAIITRDGDFWVIDSEWGGFDHRITIKEASGLAFTMTDITKTAQSCIAWTRADDSMYFDGCAGVAYTGEPIKALLVTANAPFQWRFKVVAAV